MKRTFLLLIIFILFNFANYGETYNYGEPYSLRGKKYWEYGATLGIKEKLIFRYSLKLNDYLITGLSLTAVPFGYGLETYALIPIKDNTNFRTCIGFQTGYFSQTGSWYRYLGVTGDILWEFLYTKFDVNVGRSNKLSPVQIGFQIGIILRNLIK